MSSIPPRLVATDFAGRVALVTGCGSPDGIGFAVASALASRAASVAITSTTERIHDRAAELTTAGCTALPIVADLTVAAEVSALVGAVLDRFGRIDVLVN